MAVAPFLLRYSGGPGVVAEHGSVGGAVSQAKPRRFIHAQLNTPLTIPGTTFIDYVPDTNVNRDFPFSNLAIRVQESVAGTIQVSWGSAAFSFSGTFPRAQGTTRLTIPSSTSTTAAALTVEVDPTQIAALASHNQLDIEVVNGAATLNDTVLGGLLTSLEIDFDETATGTNVSGFPYYWWDGLYYAGSHKIRVGEIGVQNSASISWTGTQISILAWNSEAFQNQTIALTPPAESGWMLFEFPLFGGWMLFWYEAAYFRTPTSGSGTRNIHLRANSRKFFGDTIVADYSPARVRRGYYFTNMSAAAVTPQVFLRQELATPPFASIYVETDPSWVGDGETIGVLPATLPNYSSGSLDPLELKSLGAVDVGETRGIVVQATISDDPAIEQTDLFSLGWIV